MTVTVKLFGAMKAQLGHVSELTVRLEQGRLVRDLVEAIHAVNPEVGKLLLDKKVIVSVNHDIAHDDTELAGSDEIALLPPFSGGARASSASRRMHVPARPPVCR